MIAYPEIDPIAFKIYTWPVYWYGLMYLVGFALAWIFLALRIRFSKRGFNQDQLSDIIFYAALGAIIGGRLGYMLFYDWQTMVTTPVLILETWKGGMSFHGGLLGVLIAMFIYARVKRIPFLAIMDLIAPAAPLGLGAGRMGNFINGELWGRVTTSDWGMIFPMAGPLARHPSQLYELAGEGLLLFIILWLFSWKNRPMGAVSGLFALLYGLIRMALETFREPDAGIGYLWRGTTEGQWLSLPLVLIGLILIIRAYRLKETYPS